MKVTIVFDKTRMVFDSVDTLTFGQFVEAVAAKLGLDLNSFDILLGDNVVWLDAASPLTNFGIISGDLLYVRLKTGHSDGAINSRTRDGVPNPTTLSSLSSVGIASQATSAGVSTLKAADVEMREPLPPTTAAFKPTIEIPADKELDVFLISFIVHSMLREGFAVFELESINTPHQIRRMFSKTTSRDIAVQISLDVYRDVVPPGIDHVTSVALTWMTLTHKSGRRHFRDTIYLYRDTPMFSELLYNLITQMCQSVLGPSNDFLRILSRVEVADIFRFLSPANMLSVESTCRYARNLCCSSTLIDETVWRLALRQRYGDLEVSKVAAVAKLKTSKPGMLPRTFREAYIRRRKQENASHIFSASRHYVQPPSSFVDGRLPPAATPAALPSCLPVGPSAPGLGQPDVSYPPDAPLMQPCQPINPDINPLMPGFGHMVMPNQPHRPLHPNIDPHHPFAPDGTNSQPGLPDMPLESITRPPNIFAKRRDPFGRGGSFDGNFPGGGFIG